MPLPVASGQAAAPQPTAIRLLLLWTVVGLQSFGGGQAVQLYAYEALVVSRAWITPDDWSRDWGICQVAPGVGLIALATLLGHRMTGIRGAFSSLFGLLVPSIIITVLLAAVYEQIRDVAIVQAGIHGLVMAATGGSLLVAVRIISPVLTASRARGSIALAGAYAVMLAAILLILETTLPLFIIIIGGAALLSAAFVLTSRWLESPS